jgi:hypothetical protein
VVAVVVLLAVTETNTAAVVVVQVDYKWEHLICHL